MTPSCRHCGGTGYYVPDLPPAHPQYGKAIRCNRCDSGLAARSGLNDQEMRLTAASIQGRNHTAAALRHLVDYIVKQPSGWLVLWGDYGTAKTLCVQAIVAGCLRANIPSRFYHAKRLEQGWFDDMQGDTAYGRSYREIPVLAIDEIDKINLRSDWVRAGLQELLDSRYRAGIAGTQLTLLICQTDPATVLPGDITSRMNDGRFYRPWTGGENKHAVNRWGVQCLPGVIRVQGADARPMLRPQGVARAEVQP